MTRVATRASGTTISAKTRNIIRRMATPVEELPGSLAERHDAHQQGAARERATRLPYAAAADDRAQRGVSPGAG